MEEETTRVNEIFNVWMEGRLMATGLGDQEAESNGENSTIEEMDTSSIWSFGKVRLEEGGASWKRMPERGLRWARIWVMDVVERACIGRLLILLFEMLRIRRFGQLEMMDAGSSESLLSWISRTSRFSSWERLDGRVPEMRVSESLSSLREMTWEMISNAELSSLFLACQS
jgi:hypothetical protein